MDDLPYVAWRHTVDDSPTGSRIVGYSNYSLSSNYSVVGCSSVGGCSNYLGVSCSSVVVPLRVPFRLALVVPLSFRLGLVADMLTDVNAQKPVGDIPADGNAQKRVRADKQLAKVDGFEIRNEPVQPQSHSRLLSSRLLDVVTLHESQFLAVLMLLSSQFLDVSSQLLDVLMLLSSQFLDVLTLPQYLVHVGVPRLLPCFVE